MLTEKYRPDKLSAYVGQKSAVEDFVKWMRDWKPGKGVVLHGPPGVGKTTLVYAFARENNIDLIETNASDLRSSKELSETMSSAVSQKSLFNRGKIFLFDEVDGISGYEDKGGVGEMIRIVESSKYPVVMIANDPYSKKLYELRKRADMVAFRKLTVWDVMKRLQLIADAERVFVSRDYIHDIAKKSGGDMRSAINDLELVCRSVKPTVEDMRHSGLREREVSIFDAMGALFKATSARMARDSIGNVDKEPDEIFWWIENNITGEYEDPEEVAKAYDMLSRADVFRNRIRSRQNWKFLAYMIDMMTGGVAVSKKAPYRKYVRYQYPQNIAIMGRTKGSRAATKEVFSIMTKELHCSSRKIKWEMLPYLRIMAKEDGFRGGLEKEMKLEEGALDFLA
ncbi:MAG: replication factor C large subunit [Candidatus Aenigmarchaeota archaeon]|nr:replication factor C large subunit [Candidatus Aenigmarchaeota archaeon]